ncbi:MAG: methyltransferase [Streptosporangiaceae bacterium]
MVSPEGAAGADGRTGIIARSVHGLEWVCAWEACNGGAVPSGVRLSRRQVDFEVGSSASWLLGLRAADDVFVRVGATDIGPAKADLPALGQAAAALDWRRPLERIRAVRPVPEHGSFDVVASIEGRRSYNRFAVERSIGLAVAPILGATFADRADGARAGAHSEFTVRVFVRDDQATIAVRLGVRPLHRRAYKVNTGPGTLHPPVAAALIAIGGLAASTLADPFCGDGTIAIEAALARPQLRILASDADPLRVHNARENAGRAGVNIGVRLGDAGTLADRVTDVDAIITNPPWNQAVSASGQLRTSGHEFVDSLARALRPDGVLCCIAEADLGVPAMVSRRGWQLGLVQRIRLAGRVADVSLATPPGGSLPSLPLSLARWRQDALAAGIVTESGF